MFKVIIEYPALNPAHQEELRAWLQRIREVGAVVSVPMPAQPTRPESSRSAVTEADLDELEQRWLASAKQRFLNAKLEDQPMGSRLLDHGAFVTMGCYFELKDLREKAKALSAVRREPQS